MGAIATLHKAMIAAEVPRYKNFMSWPEPDEAFFSSFCASTLFHAVYSFQVNPFFLLIS
jgi:hypothetical protein